MPAALEPPQTSAPSAAVAADRYASLDQLLATHRGLMREPDEERIRTFLPRALATGVILESRDERRAAQGAVNYWVSRAASTACGDDEPCTVTTHAASLLADYDPATVGHVAAAADALLAKHPDWAALARKIGLRLVRLRPDGKVFDPVPATRASLMELDDDSDVKDILESLLDAGVIRVTAGESTDLDLISLRSPALVDAWPSMRAWQAVRRKRWQDAEDWGKKKTSLGHREGIGRRSLRFVDKSIRTADRLRVLLNRQMPRITAASTSEMLYRDDDLKEARDYHDRSSDEKEFHAEGEAQAELMTNRNRFIMLIALAAAVLCAFFMVLAILKWRESRYNEDVARESEKEAKKYAAKADQNAIAATFSSNEAKARASLSWMRILIRAYSEVMAARTRDERDIKLVIFDDTVAMLPKYDSEGDFRFLTPKELEWVVGGIRIRSDQSFAENESGKFTGEWMVMDIHAIRELRDRLVKAPAVDKTILTMRKTNYQIVEQIVDGILWEMDRKELERKPRYELLAPLIQEFWKQYWGEMLLVEGPAVEGAMVEFGRALNQFRADTLPLPDIGTPRSKPTFSAAPRMKESAAPPASLPRESKTIVDELKTLSRQELEAVTKAALERPIRPETVAAIQAAGKVLKTALAAERPPATLP